jgi:hypothetical protein
VTAKGATGGSFQAVGTPPAGSGLGSVGFSIPPFVCLGGCTSTSTLFNTEFSGPYDVTVVLFSPPDGAGAVSELTRSKPVRVTIGAAETVDQAAVKITAKEIAGNLGASIVSLEASYYSVSGSLLPATTTLELSCPTALSVHYRYQAEPVCGKILTMTEIGKNALFRSILEISNTTAQYQQISAVVKMYDLKGQMIVSGKTTYSVRPTGALAAGVITFSQPSAAQQFSYSDDISVSWSPYGGDFDYYVLEAGNVGGDAVSVMVPFIQKSESSVRVLASDISNRVGRIGYSGVATDGYFFRVTALRGYGSIASGQTGQFSIKQSVSAVPRETTLPGIGAILENLMQSLTALLRNTR